MPTVFEEKPQQKLDNEHSSPARPSHHDRMTLFTSYAERPLGVHFETQHEEEEVVIFMRPHFVVNIPWIAATVLLVAAPFGIIPFLLSFATTLPPIPIKYYVVGLAFWYVATFGYALVNFILWYYNLYIVTTERVIDIDFLQLLYKRLSEARLKNIEDVTYAAGGFFAAVFHYGNIYIQTAGETRNFEFHYIPRPADVVKTIGTLIKQAHKT
jgi:uncharacterized membrane protein YdbT with pleckstrin-like domain